MADPGRARTPADAPADSDEPPVDPTLDRQGRTLIWLAGALIALVGVIVLVKPPSKNGDDERWTRAFPGLDPASIQSLELKKKDEQIEFQRDSGHWKLTVTKEGEPAAELPPDEDSIDALVDSFANVEVGEDLGATDTKQFGLDPPRVVVTATLKGEGKRVLRVGDDAPAGSHTYVQVDSGAVGDASAVVATRYRLSGAFTSAASEFRNKKVVDFSRSLVKGIDITSSSGKTPLQLSKDDHGWWVGAGDTQQPADPDRIDKLLDALLDLRADSYLPAGAALTDGQVAGEGTTTVGLIVANSGEDKRTHRVQVALAKSGESWRVKGPVQPGPVEVRSTDLDSLLGASNDASAWYSTRLMPVRTATITTIDAKLGDARLHSKRTDNGWDADAAEGFLDALEAVRVDRTQAAPPPGAEWGVITLAEGDDGGGKESNSTGPGRSEVLHLYQQTDDGGRVAVDEAGGQPFVVPATEVRRLLDALVAPAKKSDADASDSG